MPKIGFTSDNKVQTTNYDFPKLKLKNGERARIVVLQDAEMEYTHNFRKPLIENGKPKMETAKRRSGEEYKTNVMKFIRNPLCRGDFETLQKAGSDPKNCPACAMAKEHPDWMAAPKRRYAMHVIRYRTQSGKFLPAEPFAVETLVWSFTDRIFNKLIEFGEEIGGPLSNVDLLLGPCENEGFQKFDIVTGSKAEWKADEGRVKMVKETLKGGMIPDLKIALGNDQNEFYMKQDLEEIAEAWAQASGVEVQPQSGSLSEGLDNLFDGQSGAKEVKREEAQTDWVAEGTETPADEAPKSKPSSVDDDLLADILGGSTSNEEESAPAASESSSDGDSFNFDDLLNSVDK